MEPFISVRSDWFLQYVGPELDRVKDRYVAEIDPDFEKSRCLAHIFPQRACLALIVVVKRMKNSRALRSTHIR